MEDKQVCVYIHQTLVLNLYKSQSNERMQVHAKLLYLSCPHALSYMLSVHVYKSQSNEQMHASTSCTIAIYQYNYVCFHVCYIPPTVARIKFQIAEYIFLEGETSPCLTIVNDGPPPSSAFSISYVYAW